MSNSPIIAPFTTGLELDLEPWIAPPDSFSNLNNMHIRHDFLEKRNGYQDFGVAPSQLTNATAVTGFGNYIETATGARTLLAFDTRSAYTYNSAAKTFTQLVDSIGALPTIFGGDADDFVWSANWLSTDTSNINRLYFSNGRPLSGGVDGIWYYANTAPTVVTSFSPTVRTGVTLNGTKLIFSLGQRLICLHTYEGGSNTQYPQRARWCAKQNPGNWVDTVAGGGGFVDAATSDQIISAFELQNQIIVLFTNSTWTLIPTSDPKRAFTWRKINDFRSCNAKMAVAGFDRYVASLGVRGIIGTDGNNSYRIDERISSFSINEISQEFFDQTFCLRDYNNRRWWTLYNDSQSDDTTKTKALIRDDDSGAYSTYSIEMNVLGHAIPGWDYLYSDFTAANGFTAPNGDDKRYTDFTEEQTYTSYFFQKDAETLIGGAYDGTVYVMDSANDDMSSSYTAEFTTAAWNPFKEEGREALMSFVDLYVTTSPTAQGIIYFYKDSEVTPYAEQSIDFLPDLKFIGAIQNTSQANPCQVTVGDHGLSTGDVVYIYHVEGQPPDPLESPMNDVNSGGDEEGYTITVVDANNFTLDGVDSTLYSAYLTGGEIYENPFYRTKTWVRAFGGGIGFQHRIGFKSTGESESFRIHGFKPTFKPRGSRMVT